MQKFSSGSPRHFVFNNERDRFWSFVSGHPVFAPIEDFELRCALILMYDDYRMNRLSPFLVRNANCSHVLDLGMSAKNLLHFRWIDILPAADDHIALAVGEIVVAVLVVTGQIANGAIRSSERLSGLLRRFPVAFKRVWRARIKFTDFAVNDLVTF
jgi:hypothetical protein